MEDIMFSYPEHCGEHSCPVGWHLYHVWTNGRGFSVSDSDGDHEWITKKDYNALWKAHDRMWREYAIDVLDTGVDVLDNYLVSDVIKYKQKWLMRFRDTGMGVILTEARPLSSRRWKFPDKLPKEVLEYCNVQHTNTGWVLQDFATMTDLLAATTKAKLRTVRGRVIHKQYAHLTYEIEMSKPNRKYAAELRALVEKDLERLDRLKEVKK